MARSFYAFLIVVSLCCALVSLVAWINIWRIGSQRWDGWGGLGAGFVFFTLFGLIEVLSIVGCVLSVTASAQHVFLRRTFPLLAFVAIIVNLTAGPLPLGFLKAKTYYRQNPPLVRAVKDGSIEQVRVVLNSRAASLHLNAEECRLSLQSAIQQQNWPIVELLVDFFESSPGQSSFGVDKDAALVYAAKNSSRQILTKLLAKGADPNNPPPGHWSAINHAVHRGGDPAILEALLKSGAKTKQVSTTSLDPLFQAVLAGNVKAMEIMLRYDEDPHFKLDPARGSSLLGATVGRWNKAEMIRLLLKAGADVNKPYGQGNSPLRHAILMNDKEAQRIFIEQGAVSANVPTAD